MLFAALRDMQWRRRRLVIAVISTGLVFAMTLVLTGLANGFRVEAQRTVDSMRVDDAQDPYEHDETTPRHLHRVSECCIDYWNPPLPQRVSFQEASTKRGSKSATQGPMVARR
ncbi:hypothetical protein A5764_24810 [Mycobacterium sp. 852002-51057_SCH5723018]|nr:hypothetical protein A5764_24810 [Mycobacterium sp. 852002-51057_SCH5723018]